MNRYFKKFGIMFVMAFAIMLGTCISAFATDDGSVVGVANLNNTVENSAKIGDQLNLPEIGWKRYDDSNSRILYNGNKWIHGTGSSYEYTGTIAATQYYGDTINFKFYGTKLRIVGEKFRNSDTETVISIDGVQAKYGEANTGAVQPINLVYEKLNLSLGVHDVTITKGTNQNSYIRLDAIDIDSDGKLLPYNESITLDKSTMNLSIGDSGQLTATTTPAAVGVTWKSSDESVATADSNGKVTGIKEGTCTVTASTANGAIATCTVTVTRGGNTDPTQPTTGDANLFIELVDGQIKQYSVSQDEINKFTTWFENRDKDHSLSATYKFAKGSYADYVVHDQIDWFEVR